MDSHIYSGYTVPPYYDSLLGKLISWAPDRNRCLNRMRRALDELVIDGIKTNSTLHRDTILRDSEFARGGVDIHHLEHILSR